MTTWERIRVGDKTIILRNPTEVDFLGSRALTGIECDKEDREIAPKGVDERRHLIQLGQITKRTTLKMNNHYGRLEEI